MDDKMLTGLIEMSLDKCPAEYRASMKEMSEKIMKDMKEKGPDYEWSIDDFQIGCPMGRGKFGRVYLAREKNTHYMVALKVLFKDELLKYNMEHQILREIEIQTHLMHPNILHMHTYFSDECKIYFVLEFAAGGELYKHLQSQPHHRFPEKIAASYICQVMSGIEYCHKNNVIHRDIKPENILLAADGSIKLADFGWSVHAPSNRRKTMCGTIDYIPPEMIKGTTYTKEVDHWCIGVLCFEFLVGRPPFESKDQQTTFDKIKVIDLKYPSVVTAGARDLISKLLQLNPKDRLPLLEGMEHPWIIQMNQE